MRLTELRLAGALLSALVSTGARADEATLDSNHLSVGPGVYSLPSYPGARSTKTRLIPFVDAEYESRLYSSASDVVGVYAYKSATTQTGVALDYDFSERRARDDERFRYLRDIPATPRLKGFASRTLGFVTGDANLATDAAGRGQGTLGTANIWLSTPTLLNSQLSVGPGLTWADAKYMKRFYGITAAESAVSSLPAYRAAAGLLDLHWNALATCDLSRRFSLGASAYVGRLRDDPAHSPVTLDRKQATVLIWLAYRLR